MISGFVRSMTNSSAANTLFKWIEPVRVMFEKLNLVGMCSHVWIEGRNHKMEEKDQLENLTAVYMWFTYRTGFKAIDTEGTVSKDTGWGCMIRCGQMLLARALCRHYANKESLETKTAHVKATKSENQNEYHSILRMFHDDPDSKYSIHRIVRSRDRAEYKINDWFGPNTIAQSLRRLSLDPATRNQMPIYIYVALDQLIVTSDILNGWQEFTQSLSSPLLEDVPLLLIIPMRTGNADFNVKFFPMLVSFYHMQWCVGSLGGLPRHAVYLLGVSGDCLMYLDPHVTQKFVEDPISDEVSFHTKNHDWMHKSRLDPTIAPGFLCKNKSDFEDFIQKLDESRQDPCLFEIVQQHPCQNLIDDFDICNDDGLLDGTA